MKLRVSFSFCLESSGLHSLNCPLYCFCNESKSAIYSIMRYQEDINTEHNMKSICRPSVAQWTKRLTRNGLTRVPNWKGALLMCLWKLVSSLLANTVHPKYCMCSCTRKPAYILVFTVPVSWLVSILYLSSTQSLVLTFVRGVDFC